jgi:hypothetical protein
VSRATTSVEVPSTFDANDPFWVTPGLHRVKIDAVMAAQILDGANTRNRTIAWTKVSEWSREMQKGNWVYNPSDALSFSNVPTLLNGQHRLLSVLDCGVPQEFALATGVDPAAQDVMDTGLKRSAAHQLSLSGYADPKQLAAIARVALLWEQKTITSGLRSPSTPTVRTWVESTDAEGHRFAIGAAKRVSALFKLRPGVTGAAAYEAWVRGPELAEQFFSSLCEGSDLEPDNPILVLRNYLTRQNAIGTRFREPHQLWLLVSTWNTWRSERTLKKISSPSEWSAASFPRMH